MNNEVGINLLVKYDNINIKCTIIGGARKYFLQNIKIEKKKLKESFLEEKTLITLD